MPTNTGFDFTWFSGGRYLSPLFTCKGQVFRMNCSLPTPTVRFFRRQAGIVAPSLVEEFFRTIWQTAPYDGGNGIHDCLETGVRLVRVDYGILQVVVGCLH